MFAYSAVGALFALCVCLGVAAARARKRNRHLQKLLIKAEQLATLGSAVPALTHDVNTNLGVCISAVTFLTDTVNETKRLFDAGTLARSNLERHLKTEQESCDLLFLNLSRAADLISSFKKVSVDNTSFTFESFELDEYLRQIITSLTPKLRKTNHRVEVRCDSGITLKGKPSLIYQIITNLVSNALMHAFDGTKAGLIEIDGNVEGDTVILRVRDDGKGMSESTAERAFTPFFTTKKGEGGTGLGLSIVQSIVRDELRGSIECESAPGKGTAFTIRFPRSLPALPEGMNKKEPTA